MITVIFSPIFLTTDHHHHTCTSKILTLEMLRMECLCSPQPDNSYIGDLSPHVMVFGDGAFKR